MSALTIRTVAILPLYEEMCFTHTVCQVLNTLVYCHLYLKQHAAGTDAKFMKLDSCSFVVLARILYWIFQWIAA